jgi:hypothetical protein
MRANCWKCGGRNAAAAIALLCRVSEREAAAAIGSGRRVIEPQSEAVGVLRRPTGVAELLPPHRRYLEGRGFDPDVIASTWGVQGLGPQAKLKWRLYIPIFDRNGREVSWTTRSISTSAERRYRSASEDEEAVPHKSLLYGAHLAGRAIVIVEGPIDAWAIGPGAVATCGLSYSPAQFAAMCEYPVRVVCFDSTPDAQERADKLCSRLSVLAGQTENVMLETGDDAADADADEVEELRRRYLCNDAIGECR